jgi:hypothetical protein
MTTLDYTSLKEIAKQNKTRVTSLLALAPQNDPFYVGTKSDLVMAQWFTDLWNQFGYDTGVHLRRMHYNTQALGDVKLPVTLSWKVKETGQRQTTDVYINNEACWNYLCKAGKAARYLGMVKASAFIDRRNPAAIVNYQNPDPDHWSYVDPEPRQELSSGWHTKNENWETDDNDRYALPELPELDDLPSALPGHPELIARGYEGTPQPYLVEIWAEKSTMDDVLNPLCEQYQVNYIRGLGEMSITSVIDYLNRVKSTDRASRILYISDYDPAGVGMPISVSRKIEFYLSLLRDEGHDIALKPIVLNPEQIETYSLPSAPVKDSDRRKAGFEAAHGEAVELDALEALHPGALAKIVEGEITNYYDKRWGSKLRNAKYNLQSELTKEVDLILEDYEDDLEDIGAEYADLQNKWQAIRDKFADLIEPFQPEIDTCKAELESITERIKNIHSEIESELDNVEVEYPALPEPALPDEPDDILFNSGRDYFDQLEYYQDWRNGS